VVLKGYFAHSESQKVFGCWFTKSDCTRIRERLDLVNNTHKVLNINAVQMLLEVSYVPQDLLKKEKYISN